MAVTATPTFSPTGGKTLGAATFTLTCITPSSTIRYTYGDTTQNTGWTTYSTAVTLPTASGSHVTVSAYATSGGNTDSLTATTTFDIIGYSAAVASSAVTVIDTNTTQGLGSVVAGIGSSGSDGASISASRIGGSTGTDLKIETGNSAG